MKRYRRKYRAISMPIYVYAMQITDSTDVDDLIEFGCTRVRKGLAHFRASLGGVDWLLRIGKWGI